MSPDPPSSVLAFAARHDARSPATLDGGARDKVVALPTPVAPAAPSVAAGAVGIGAQAEVGVGHDGERSDEVPGPDRPTLLDRLRGWPFTGIAATASLLDGALVAGLRRFGRDARRSAALASALEALPDAVALFDRHGRLEAFNDKLLSLIPVELEREALLGAERDALYAWLSPDARAVRRARGAARETAADPDATISFELPSYGRRPLFVRERPTADGGTAISLHGGAFARASDPLTALATRARLVGELARRCGQGAARLALLIVDLRSFRQINDTYGREAGDELLRQTALCLQRGMPRDALIARTAGDEFAILLELDAADGHILVERRAASLLAMLRRGLAVHAMNVPVRASVGIAYAPEHGESVTELLGAADSACAHAKQLGNNALAVYNSRRQREAKRRHQLEVGLQQAIARDELSLQYQPQVDVRSKMTCGMEALLRWRSAEFGAVSPADFIPIAEHTGIITRLGRWVLERAIEDYRRLAQFGMSPAMLSVNLSRRQFEGGNIVREIERLLGRTGFDPAKLCLEITETALFSDSRRLREMLGALTALGARLAIDDFGVGYSSLLELRDFPIGEVKIDRAFVTDIATDVNSQDIVRAIVSIAGSIGAEVVAEGIENQAQFDTVAALGCDRAQGYWLCEPMAATTFPDVVLGA